MRTVTAPQAIAGKLQDKKNERGIGMPDWRSRNPRIIYNPSVEVGIEIQRCYEIFI
jgi:hypothetical protein